MRPRISKRIFKKSLRKKETYLGEILCEYDFDISNSEFLGRLDFWVSYYVTSLLKRTDTSKEIWSDGVLWKDGKYVLSFKAIHKASYHLSCELDLQDRCRMYQGGLDLLFEFDDSFSKFVSFQAKILFQERQYQFSEKY